MADIKATKLNKSEIVDMLAMADFSSVYCEADRIRRENVGDTVHLRAIIEFSNVCKRQCVYCGLNRRNKELPRFRMSHEEIIAVAAEAVAAGYRTIVLQSGEDDFFTKEKLGRIIEDIKALELPQTANTVQETVDAISQAAGTISQATDMVQEGADAIHPAVTLSCGERSKEDYRYLREKGADRYLLKHETADPDLYNKLHPCGTLKQRVDCLKNLKQLGYEAGSGFMIGLPGQTLEALADDLLLLREIPCKMAGIGPFISNPKTPLAGEKNGDPELARRAVAIARILLPEANLPLTTSLSVLAAEEKDLKSGACNSSPEQAENNVASRENNSLPEKGDNPFAFGANVIMKKVTPDVYKTAYEIYPAKFKPTKIAEDRKELEQLIRGFGRVPL